MNRPETVKGESRRPGPQPRLLPAALNHKDAAFYIGRSSASLTILRQNGVIPAFVAEPEETLQKRERIHWLYMREDLDQYLRSCKQRTHNILNNGRSHDSR